MRPTRVSSCRPDSGLPAASVALRAMTAAFWALVGTGDGTVSGAGREGLRQRHPSASPGPGRASSAARSLGARPGRTGRLDGSGRSPSSLPADRERQSSSDNERHTHHEAVQKLSAKHLLQLRTTGSGSLEKARSRRQNRPRATRRRSRREPGQRSSQHVRGQGRADPRAGQPQRQDRGFSLCCAESSSAMDAATIRPSITTGHRWPTMPGSPWLVKMSTACR